MLETEIFRGFGIPFRHVHVVDFSSACYVTCTAQLAKRSSILQELILPANNPQIKLTASSLTSPFSKIT